MRTVTVCKFLGTGLLMSAIFAGCIPTLGFLKPKEQPREEIASAVIKTPSPILKAGTAQKENKHLVRISAVDKKPNQYLENRAVVAPGVHTIDVTLEMQNPANRGKNKTLITKANTSLTFEAKADGEYIIDAREDSEGVWVWVTDTANDQVVAGSRPGK